MLQAPTRGPSNAEQDTFATRLAYVIEQRNVSLEWIEEKSGLSNGHVSRLVSKNPEQKRGTAPWAKTIEALSETLFVDYRWLSTGKMPRRGWQAIFIDVEPTSDRDDDRVAEIARRVVRELQEKETGPTSRPRHLHPVGGRNRPKR